MEEGLVLDLSETGMVQEGAVHEASRLKDLPFIILSDALVLFTVKELIDILHVGFFVTGIFVSILLVGDSILARLLIELAFHEDVKEHGHSSVVCQLTVDICRPEEGMLVVSIIAWEADHINGDVTDYILLVQFCANGLTDLCQVNLR